MGKSDKLLEVHGLQKTKYLEEIKNCKKFVKAVIPAARLGHRFLTATKAWQKRCCQSLINQPFQFIVEESNNSGFEDILIVTGEKVRRPIEDHFDSNPELGRKLRAKDKPRSFRVG